MCDLSILEYSPYVQITVEESLVTCYTTLSHPVAVYSTKVFSLNLS